MEFTLTFIYLFGKIVHLAGPILILFFGMIVAFGQAVGRLEKWSILDALYWTFITATTVGYGDMRPQKKVSRLLSVLIAFSGLVFTGLVIAIALQAASISFSISPEYDHIQEHLKELGFKK